MPDRAPALRRHRFVSRREFLMRVGWGGVGAAALAAAMPRRAAFADGKYPDWIPASTKPPRRGGSLTKAAIWDPPVIDPRLTQSVGTYQFASLVGSRIVRYPFPDEASGPGDLTLVGVERRPPDLDVQDPPRRQVAQRGPRQRP